MSLRLNLLNANIKYSPQLDGLRAVCIFFTICDHIKGTPGIINGSVGVDIFFALSGFLIAGVILSEEKFSLKAYYIRRFFRIAPVYYLTFALTAILALGFTYFTGQPDKLNQLSNSWLLSLLFCREYVSGAPTLFGQAWTLGIECKFYVLCPFVLLLAKKSYLRIFILTSILLIFIFLPHSLEQRGYGALSAGCLTAIAYFVYKRTLSIWIGALALSISYVLSTFYNFPSILLGLSAALFVPALYEGGSVISKWLSQNWLVFIGKLTYPVYLLHVICINLITVILAKLLVDNWWAHFILTYLLCIFISWFVYTYVERVYINKGKLLAQRMSS